MVKGGCKGLRELSWGLGPEYIAMAALMSGSADTDGTVHP